MSTSGTPALTPEQLRKLAERRRGGMAQQARPVHTIAPRHGAGPVPLTPAQEALWFADQVAVASPFIMRHVSVLHGPLDVEKLDLAIAAVSSRHELLRSNIKTIDGKPYLVCDESAITLTRHEEASKEEARAIADAAIIRPYDLTREKPLRAGVIPMGAERHVFYLALHHIAGDAASMDVLIGEISEAYRGAAARLPALPVQFGDYAAWLRRDENAARRADEVRWWTERLGDLEPFTLPPDLPPPADADNRADAVELPLPDDLVPKLNALCRAEGVTAFAVCLSVFTMLLARHSGRTDLAVATTISERDLPEVRPLIGLLVNKVAVRLHLDGEQSFRDLAQAARTGVSEAFARKQAPFSEIVRALPAQGAGGERAPSRVSFMLHTVKPRRADLDGLAVEPWGGQVRASEDDVECHVFMAEGRLRLALTYRTALHSRASMEAMAHHFGVLLRGALERPDAALRDLPMLGDEERQRLMALSAPPAETALPHATLHDWFAAQAGATPRQPAVEWPGGALSFAGVAKRVDTLAHYLAGLGFGRGTTAAVAMGRGWPLPIALLGIMRAGAAYVPLDSSDPPERLRFQAEDCGAGAVLTDAGGYAALKDSGLPLIDIESGWSEIAQSEPMELPTVEADDIAYAIYTSGSTGEPKAALIPHRAIVNHMSWLLERWPMSSTDAVLQKTSIAFDAAVWELFAPLLSGARLVLAPPGAEREPDKLIETIHAHRITHIQGTPGWLAQMFGHPGMDQCRSLEQVFSSGETLTAEVRDRIRTCVPVGIENLYGPAEACINSLSHDCTHEKSDPMPIGRPIANMHAYVLDVWDDLAPLNRPGELWLAGTGVARGYLNRPELTAQRFGRTPQGRIYRTGDLARMRADGVFEHLGRADRQIKINGRRVEPGEIEQVLMRHPSVAEAVAAFDDRERLTAYVTGHAGMRLDMAALERYAAERLPAHMMPRIVAVEHLPRLGNGKLDRAALKLLTPADDAPAVPPQTHTEQALASLWEALLGVDGVSRDSDFFALGGHSLLAMELVAWLQSEFGPVISVNDLFRFPTLKALARHLDNPAGIAIRTPIVPLAQGTPGGGIVLVPHDVAGSVFPAMPLARGLPGGRTVLGVQQLPDDRSGGADLRLRAEAVAELVANSHRREAVAILGYSFGASLGWELAHALSRRGVTVAGLVAIDQDVADARTLNAMEMPDDIEILEHMVAAVTRRTGQHGPVREQLEALDADERIALVARWTQGETRSAELPDIGAQMRIYRHNLIAAMQWKPQPGACPVTLLGTAPLSARHPGDPSCGWRALAPEDVLVVTVPGDHYSLLQPPHLATVTSRVHEALERLFARADIPEVA